MKDSRPTVLSLFSGVGGFDMGLESAGMRTVYQCEIDKHCRSVLDRHWPHVPKWSDISSLTGDEILSHAPEIDVVAWGSPCQDLSVAGARAGLDGTRSSLFHEGIRIINEIRKATDGTYPRISIWENVYGALTSNKGADFRVILAEMAKVGSIFSEWRVLDAQFFGIPQRRRRVFVISVFDTAVADRCAEPILPISESVRRDTEKSRPTQEGTAASTAPSTDGGDQWAAGSDERDVLRTSVTSKWYKGTAGPSGQEFYNLVVRSPILIDRASYNAGANAQYKLHISDADVSPSLVATGPHAVAQDSQMTLAFDTQFGSNANVTADVAPTLKSSQQSPSVAIPNTPSMTIRRLTPLETERLMGWPDDHTRYRADGSEQADTHRYRQCGNGVASPVAEWIGEQIVMHL